MSGKRYIEEFRMDAVKPLTERAATPLLRSRQGSASVFTACTKR